MKFYNDILDNYEETELTINNADSYYDLIYKSDTSLIYRYIINLKDSISFKYIKNDTLKLIKTNHKVFNVNNMEIDIYNFSCQIPTYGYEVRYFWCKEFGIFYSYNCSDLVFVKLVKFDNTDNLIFDELIKQIHDDSNFFHNLNMPDSVLKKLKSPISPVY